MRVWGFVIVVLMAASGAEARQAATAKPRPATAKPAPTAAKPVPAPAQKPGAPAVPALFETPLTLDEMRGKQVVLTTALGDVVIDLLPEHAPNHVGLFM